LTEVAPPFSLDETAARDWLKDLANEVCQAPRDARLDIAEHRRVPAEPGRALDIDGSMQALRTFASTPANSIVLPIIRQEPAVTLSDLPPVDVSRVLASYETDFRKKAGRRAVNIRRAAELLDGAIIYPGEEFSFNRVVGPRELSRGFINAPVIVEDEMEPGVGGGVCQVATTLHAAAVFGNLDIVERRSHSRPSGYAPLGLDATVIDGEVDLRLRNPFEQPIMVVATLPSQFRIRVALLGVNPPGKVEHTYAVTQRHDFYRRIVEKEDLPPGSFERTQKGGYGYDTVSRVEVALPNGKTRHHRYTSKYYPVPEVYWVGPQTRLDALPPLPEGASHVEM
jgi:vancomycin resistance protein YoaR